MASALSTYLAFNLGVPRASHVSAMGCEHGSTAENKVRSHFGQGLAESSSGSALSMSQPLPSTTHPQRCTAAAIDPSRLPARRRARRRCGKKTETCFPRMGMTKVAKESQDSVCREAPIVRGIAVNWKEEVAREKENAVVPRGFARQFADCG